MSLESISPTTYLQLHTTGLKKIALLNLRCCVLLLQDSDQATSIVLWTLLCIGKSFPISPLAIALSPSSRVKAVQLNAKIGAVLFRVSLSGAHPPMAKQLRNHKRFHLHMSMRLVLPVGSGSIPASSARVRISDSKIGRRRSPGEQPVEHSIVQKRILLRINSTNAFQPTRG